MVRASLLAVYSSVLIAPILGVLFFPIFGVFFLFLFTVFGWGVHKRLVVVIVVVVVVVGRCCGWSLSSSSLWFLLNPICRFAHWRYLTELGRRGCRKKSFMDGRKPPKRPPRQTDGSPMNMLFVYFVFVNGLTMRSGSGANWAKP